MNLSKFQTILQAEYAGNDTVPSSNDSEYSVRTSYAEVAVSMWEHEDGMVWNELWTTLTDASDGDKTVQSSTLQYDTPSNFIFLGGHIRTYDSNEPNNQTYWKIIRPEEAELYENYNPAPTRAYVSGNASSGYKINFLSQPTAGDTIEYPYYKTATAPSSGSDVLEMSDPYFAVFYALSKLHESDGNGDLAGLALQKAQQRLSGMRTKQMMMPHYQENNIQDIHHIVGKPGFGD